MLSRWWAGRDDVFWRSNSSGARATQRAKKGKQTKGQCGDICATDPVGAPLIDLVTFELKRGYSSRTIADVLDVDAAIKTKLQTWELFIAKAHRDHERAGSFAWAIISRRDRRTTWIWMPRYLVTELRALGATYNTLFRMAQVKGYVRRGGDESALAIDVVGMGLADFLTTTPPAAFHRLAEVA